MEREQCHLLGSQWTFSHFPFYPQAKWALLVLIPRSEGLYILEPCGPLKELSCEAGEFFLLWQPPQVYFPPDPGLHGLSLSPGVPPGLSASKCGTTWSTSRHLARSPLCPSCPSPSLLLVWINVSLFNSLVVRIPYSLIF